LFQRLPVIAEAEQEVARAGDARRVAVLEDVPRVPLDPGVEALLPEVVEHGVHGAGLYTSERGGKSPS
jgi:hypothetical protein